MGISIAALGAYPERSVRIVVVYGAGGAADSQARLLAQALSSKLGQPFVVENRPGAAGMLAHDEVAKSAADGYTLLFSAAGPLTVTPHIYARLPYDPRGFEPIKLISKMPIVLVVHPSLQATTVRELISAAKSTPGKLTYGSYGNGSAAHLAAEQFKALTKTELLHVPYKGTSQLLVDLLSGRIDIMFEVMSNAAPQIEGRKLRPLAIVAADRSQKMPDVPTMGEAGVEGFVADTWFGLLAPKGASKDIIAALSKASDDVLATKSFKDSITAMGAVSGHGTPEEFSRFLDSEFAKWGSVVDLVGIRGSVAGQK
jgi:tripartite-type tricarboxylate transporter receptor subunit TctC